MHWRVVSSIVFYEYSNVKSGTIDGRMLRIMTETGISAGLQRLQYRLFCILFFLLPVATSPAVLAGALILLLWIFSGGVYSGRRFYLGQGWTAPVLCLMVLPFLGLIYSIDPAAGLQVSEKTYYWLFAFAIACMGMTAKESGRLLWFFIGGVGFSVMISVLQHASLVPLHRGSMATGFMNHINYSLFLVFGTVLLSFRFRSAAGDKKKRWGIAGLILVFAISVALSPAKIGYIALALLSPVVLVNMLGSKRAIIAVLAAVLLSASLFFSPVVRDRVEQAGQELAAYREGEVVTSMGLRVYMCKVAARIFLDNPVLGVGTGGYKRAMRQHEAHELVGDLGHPHNTYLYMAATYGSPGLGVLLWYLWVLFKKGWLERDGAAGFAVLSFCLVLLIGSLTDTQLLTYSSGVMAALMTGISVR